MISGDPMKCKAVLGIGSKRGDGDSEVHEKVENDVDI